LRAILAAASARKRYSLPELLKGAEAMKQLNADVAWARDGEAVGREATPDQADAEFAAAFLAQKGSIPDDVEVGIDD
jgi:hypothetical protein